MPTPQAASGIIEQDSRRLLGSKWVIDVVRYQPTERPIEDRWSYAYDETSARLIVGVYDGHGGSSCAEHISEVLPQALLGRPPAQHAAVFEEIDRHLMKKFTDDHSLLRTKSSNWMIHAKVAKSGCMALVCDFDLKNMTATISNAGDCRLAIVRKDQVTSGNPGYTVVYETTDLNARAVAERERIAKEHPGEDMVLVSGRLFGRLMSTRGFGDVYYKLPCSGPLGKFTHKRYIDALSAAEDPGKVPMNEQYESFFYGYRTPPYITPRPEQSTVSVNAGDIVILASDGLWDRLTTQDATSMVWSGLQAEIPNLAGSLLQSAMDRHPPGDDTTIVVLRCATEDDGGVFTEKATGQSGTSEKDADSIESQLWE